MITGHLSLASLAHLLPERYRAASARRQGGEMARVNAASTMVTGREGDDVAATVLVRAGSHMADTLQVHARYIAGLPEVNAKPGSERLFRPLPSHPARVRQHPAIRHDPSPSSW